MSKGKRRGRLKLSDLPERYQAQVRRQLRNTPAVSSANLEPDIGNESVGKKEAPRFNTPCNIHLHSRRWKLADSDGISGKAAIDGLVHAGVFADDSPKEICRASFSQEKIRKDETEETVINIHIIKRED